MAIEVYSLTYEDVLPHLPFDTSQVSPSSKPISTTMIDGFIQDGASEMTSILSRQSIEASSLSDDDERQIQKAIKWYAVRECLAVIGLSGGTYAQADKRYTEVRDRLEADSSRVSDSRPSRVRTTIDTTVTERPSRFGSSTYKF